MLSLCFITCVIFNKKHITNTSENNQVNKIMASTQRSIMNLTSHSLNNITMTF